MDSPPVGSYKVNSNAAVLEDGLVGCGGIMRDAQGEVMGATCLRIEGTYDIDVVEAVSARRTLTIALEAGLNRVVLKSDCIKLIHHLKKQRREMTSFGYIMSDILMLAKNYVCISYSHVRRNGNKPAHSLAHLSRNYPEMRVWLEEVPDEGVVRRGA